MLAVAIAAWSTGLMERVSEPGLSAATTPLDIPPPTGLQLPAARTPQPVLTTPSAPPIDAAVLRTAVLPLLRDPDLGRRVGFTVYDLGRDQPVWTSGDDETYLPASTVKLLTTMATLQVLGGDHRFATTVVESAPTGGVPGLVLVGGGDPLLASRDVAPTRSDYPVPATLEDLVRQSVRALRAADIDRVRVGYDAGLFTGPAVNPAWERDYVRSEIVTPISALWVDQGVEPGAVSTRAPEPAVSAAEQFATALAGRGVRVVGPPAPERAADSAAVVARVESPPLDQVVQYVLERSDNEGAEVLLRHLGAATGRPASFAGGAAAMREVLVELGVPWQGVRLFDGSGLSRDDRLSLVALVEVLRLAVDPQHPELRPVVSHLPVAGFSGSLAYRFTDPAAQEGRGVARAKTGTLSHVHALAGVTLDRDGSELAFVAVADRVRLRDTLDARDSLDRIVAALAACGCPR